MCGCSKSYNEIKTPETFLQNVTYNTMPVLTVESSKVNMPIESVYSGTYSNDNDMTSCVMTDYGTFFKSDNFIGGPIFAVLGFIEEDYFVEKITQNVVFILPEDRSKIESYYYDSIYKALISIFVEDRIRDLRVSVELNDSMTKTVEVNIDGYYRIKFDDKRKPVIDFDNSIKREYMPISPENIYTTTLLIQNIIDYNPYRGDSVSVHNIQFDRSEQFFKEDTSFFHQQKMETFLISMIVALVIVSFMYLFFCNKKRYRQIL